MGKTIEHVTIYLNHETHVYKLGYDDVMCIMHYKIKGSFPQPGKIVVFYNMENQHTEFTVGNIAGYTIQYKQD